MDEQSLYDPAFLQAMQSFPEQDIVVLNDVHRFPTYREEYSLSNATITIFTKGVARVRYDNQDYTIHANEVSVVTPRHILNALDNSRDFTATVIILSHELAVEARIASFRHDHQKYHSRPFSKHTEEQIKLLLEVTHVMESVASPKLQIEHRRGTLIGLVNVFSELLTTFRMEQDKTHPPSRGTLLFNEFMDLLAANYSEHHDVQYYAQQMHMTPKYLSKIIHDATGKGAFAWISDYIINKAINLLRTRPDLTIQKIGTMVGFDEQPSFTRFFKRYANASPRDFRDHKN